VLYLFTRTPLHVGAGSSVGVIDQPVIRERHTGFPIIPGSGVKGVLRDHLKSLGEATLNDLFGQGGDAEKFSAGKISFGEARLVAFPVRSAKGAFALATSSLALQRFARDAGLSITVPPAPADTTCLAGSKLVLEKSSHKGVVLEEYRFNVAGAFPEEWEKALSGLLTDAVLSGAAGRFVLLSDGGSAVLNAEAKRRKEQATRGGDREEHNRVRLQQEADLASKLAAWKTSQKRLRDRTHFLPSRSEHNSDSALS